MAPVFALLTALAATAAAETIHGVVIFTRHGDRTAKFYPTYSLTNLGAEQVYQSGSYYRDRYLSNSSAYKVSGISSDQIQPAQVYASVPDQLTLYQTSLYFLQGFYPPLGSVNSQLSIEKLTNGTDTQDPLNGYQFVQIHALSTSDPNSIYLKGADDCPAWTSASTSYRSSPEYLDTLNSTASFYKQFEDLLNPILGAGNVTYKQAYNIFDLLNVASIHNSSISSRIDAAALNQTRYLANQWESGMNFNNTQPMRAIGGQTFIQNVLTQMNATVASKGTKQKFSLLTGSYNTFLSFFGLTNLTSTDPTFLGIPNYAGNMVFEMYSDANNASFPANPNDDLKVRFMMRNGSDAGTPLTNYPLWGEGNLNVTYGTFVNKMSNLAVKTPASWCAKCGSLQTFCAAANVTAANSGDASAAGSTGSGNASSGSTGLSNAAAGGIGAGVTLAVVGLLAGLAFLLFGRKRKATAAAPVAHERKGSGSESSSV